MSYLCSVFFMVLDLRLTESRGCRETVPIHFIRPSEKEGGEVSRRRPSSSTKQPSPGLIHKPQRKHEAPSKS